MFPSTACLVQNKIGATGAWGFDVSGGCSGFVYALQAGVKMVESGAYSKVLVCGFDANTRMTDYTDRTTCVLFGDGGGAVLLEPAAEGEIGFIDSVNEIDGSGGVSLNLKGGGSLNPSTHETVDKKWHYIYQDGPAVYKFAVRKMAEATAKLLERNGVTGADLGCFIPHQANKRIITATADRLGMDPDRVIINIEKYGNTSAGTIPAGHGDGHRRGQAEKRRSGAAGRRGRGLHGGHSAAALGDLKSSFQLSAFSFSLSGAPALAPLLSKGEVPPRPTPRL